MGLTAAALAALLSYALCLAAVRARFGLDQITERSSHTVPTPRTGGLMVLTSLLLASVLLLFSGLMEREVVVLLGLTVGAGMLGLLDDFLPLPPLVKLAVQAALAFLAAFLLGPVQTVPIPLLGWQTIPLSLALPLTVFWIVGMMNVVNFMDGLNGLIGGFAILALGAAMTVAGVSFWILLLAAGSVFGFLLCNAVRGRIFLGDAGSLSLGFLIATSGLLTEGGAYGFWLLPLVSLPLIMDVLVTLVRRALRGARLTEPHREHYYQLLKAHGWSHQAVALSLFFSGLISACLALSLGLLGDQPPLFYWLIALLIAGAWWAVMALMMAVKNEATARLEGPFR
ncbi:MAG: hypothetical protein AAF830_12960 [Pseudomonadota bacterium]